ncbi:MAG: hypothetical protein ACJ795_06620 [Ktedonobacteraceae bacterium]
MGDTAKPPPLSLRFVGKGGLDKLIRRFNVQRTELALVLLFNAAP